MSARHPTPWTNVPKIRLDRSSIRGHRLVRWTSSRAAAAGATASATIAATATTSIASIVSAVYAKIFGTGMRKTRAA